MIIIITIIIIITRKFPMRHQELMIEKIKLLYQGQKFWIFISFSNPVDNKLAKNSYLRWHTIFFFSLLALFLIFLHSSLFYPQTRPLALAQKPRGLKKNYFFLFLYLCVIGSRWSECGRIYCFLGWRFFGKNEFFLEFVFRI